MKLDKKILLLVSLLSFSMANLPAQDSNQDSPAPENQEGNNPPPPEPTPVTDPAEGFRALREKRLEEARAYQKQEEEKRMIQEEKERAERETKLQAERQKYADDKADFLKQFKKREGPTPTPTLSVLEEIEQRRLEQDKNAPEEGEADEATSVDIDLNNID